MLVFFLRIKKKTNFTGKPVLLKTVSQFQRMQHSCDHGGCAATKDLEQLDSTAKTMDPHLYFCPVHVHSLRRLRNTFKSIENDAFLQELRRGHSVPTGRAELKTLLLQMKKALELRVLFQSKLKLQIPSEGHRFYMATMSRTLETHWQTLLDEDGQEQVWKSAAVVNRSHRRTHQRHEYADHWGNIRKWWSVETRAARPCGF